MGVMKLKQLRQNVIYDMAGGSGARLIIRTKRKGNGSQAFYIVQICEKSGANSEKYYNMAMDSKEIGKALGIKGKFEVV